MWMSDWQASFSLEVWDLVRVWIKQEWPSWMWVCSPGSPWTKTPCRQTMLSEESRRLLDELFFIWAKWVLFYWTLAAAFLFANAHSSLFLRWTQLKGVSTYPPSWISRWPTFRTQWLWSTTIMNPVSRLKIHKLFWSMTVDFAPFHRVFLFFLSFLLQCVRQSGPTRLWRDVTWPCVLSVALNALSVRIRTTRPPMGRHH